MQTLNEILQKSGDRARASVEGQVVEVGVWDVWDPKGLSYASWTYESNPDQVLSPDKRNIQFAHTYGSFIQELQEEYEADANAPIWTAVNA